MSLAQFLEEELKDIISKKYGIPKGKITENIFNEKLEHLKKEQDRKLPWQKGSVMGGSLDDDLESPTEDDIEVLSRQITAFFAKFKSSTSK